MKTSPSSSKSATKSMSPSTSILMPVYDYGIIFRDKAQKKNFFELSQRQMRSTKFVDSNALKVLGVHEDINKIYSIQGWGEFLDLEALTYRRVTLEFLSSLSRRIAEPKTEVPDDKRLLEHYLTFRLFNTEHQLSFTEINEMFGWQTHGFYRPDDNFDIVPGYNKNSFWTQITGDPKYVSSTARSSKIKNPSISLIHRIFKCSLLGCGRDACKLPSRELFLLWALLSKRKLVNASHWLAATLLSAKETGDIYCGGLITLLATRDMKHRPALYKSLSKMVEALGKDNLLDIDALTRMKMITFCKGKYIWRVGNHDQMILPDQASTSLFDINNCEGKDRYIQRVDNHDCSVKVCKKFGKVYTRRVKIVNSPMEDEIGKSGGFVCKKDEEETLKVIMGKRDQNPTTAHDVKDKTEETQEKITQKKTGTRSGKVSTQKSKIGLKMCHQCQRSRKIGVVTCTKCKTKRFCITCIESWYPNMTKEQITEACPVCLNNCNCKACLRMEGPVKKLLADSFQVSNEENIEYAKYLLKSILPSLEEINQEQMAEKEIEAKIQGLSVSEVVIPMASFSRDERVYCSNCVTSIADFHRSCPKCDYDLCLSCCREFRAAQSKATGRGRSTTSRNENKSKPVCKADEKGSRLCCPAKECGTPTLEFKSFFSDNRIDRIYVIILVNI